MAKAIINLQKESGGITKISSADGTGVTEVVVPESGNLVSVGTAVTDNAIARYDGTTGKLQNSGVVVDDNGNVGIGVTPSAWQSSIGAIEQGNRTALFELSGTTVLNNNAYHTGTSWIRKTANACSMYTTINGAHYWSAAPSGTAGNAIAWTNAMALDANGNLLLTSGTGALGYGAGAGGIVTQLTSKGTAVTLNKPNGTIATSNETLSAGASAFFKVSNSLVTVADTIIVNCNSGNYHVKAFIYQGNGLFTVSITNVSGVSLSEVFYISFAIIKGSNN